MADSLARHVPRHARLTLALSGGLDSVVLLHVLLGLRERHPFELQTVHIHHALSPHADQWADFCAQLCAAGATGLSLHHVQIAPGDPAGVEAAARRERRRIFAGLEADFLLTAHQQDDQAETLMLQLMRGAGPKGLAAMAEAQQLPGWRAVQLRPLLGTSRAEVMAYAQAHGLDWVEDESNRDIRYRRNALRLQVMPVLTSHFPAARATLARAAELQADAAKLLDDLGQLDAAIAIVGERLDCGALTRLSLPRARNLLRYFIEQQGQPMPSARRLNEALHQVLDARQNASVSVRIGAADIRRFRGGVYVVPVQATPLEPVCWNGEAELRLPGLGTLQLQDALGQGLKHSRLQGKRVVLGLREGGERLRVHPRGPARSLKNLLQERAVAPWLRDRLPMLTCDGELVWVAGFGCHADWLAAADEQGLVPDWRPA
ncbi:MAG: tRNA lysidine(34) synthetase TilS [Thiobacillus sp.]